MTLTTENQELLRRMELAIELGFLHPRDAVTIIQDSETPETALTALSRSGRLPMKRVAVTPDPPQFRF